MKNLLLLASSIFLWGCSTAVPVAVKFPDPPGKTTTDPCAELQKIDADAKLSDISRTITANYTAYRECVVKKNGWEEWYQSQKKIFEGAGK